VGGRVVGFGNTDSLRQMDRPSAADARVLGVAGKRIDIQRAGLRSDR